MDWRKQSKACTLSSFGCYHLLLSTKIHQYSLQYELLNLTLETCMTMSGYVTEGCSILLIEGCSILLIEGCSILLIEGCSILLIMNTSMRDVGVLISAWYARGIVVYVRKHPRHLKLTTMFSIGTEWPRLFFFEIPSSAGESRVVTIGRNVTV